MRDCNWGYFGKMEREGRVPRKVLEHNRALPIVAKLRYEVCT